ncbi:MAG: hypothetical protein KKB90_12990 [Actinobacteria bacterium]|nr:hypothetical protein [Actinomycetota bacterium]MCG2820020.1 hypothetical protein [Actinomycetes bacterium]MBU4178527.1 hypothetical protein [Actinomycetota bacterium]MBU4219854.1 hypothetical protein [Actinomycetota bacterium]MBU4358837.1 hypothetical protein [Actinomycetota bacterium]
MKIRVADRATHCLLKVTKSDRERIRKKIREFENKPDLLEANLTIEQAGIYKDFFKRYSVKLGHFRVGDWRVIGIIEKDVFYSVGIVPRGELDKELAKVTRQFPF